MCARAAWNGVMLAETHHPVLLEGNVYFPPEDVRKSTWPGRKPGIGHKPWAAMRRQQPGLDEPAVAVKDGYLLRHRSSDV